ncbi:MAG TPA: hypothetical protein VHD33_00190 [Legionellaceae bacterium]|nr:hypothetical protein [Legionellaceae bacterium]
MKNCIEHFLCFTTQQSAATSFRIISTVVHPIARSVTLDWPVVLI